jgi:hypothetical protein
VGLEVLVSNNDIEVVAAVLDRLLDDLIDLRVLRVCGSAQNQERRSQHQSA